MRVLVLHSDVADNARADDLETLVTAQAVEHTLAKSGHDVRRYAFDGAYAGLKSAIGHFLPDVVFNLVESVHDDGFLACVAPAMLDKLGIVYTGAGAAALAVCADKLLAKRLLRSVSVPTPDWSEPPSWGGLIDDQPYIVKSATEDASLGLDDDAVVNGNAVRRRAEQSVKRFGGVWFAEKYMPGREFNVAMLEDHQGVRVLPMAEMRFEMWPEGRRQIVGYAAKWDETSEESQRTVRRFGVENEDPALAQRIEDAARASWKLFRLRGYARIDFRTDERGTPCILEANPNPCLEPRAGFAAAAACAGIGFPELLERILRAAAHP